MAQACKARQGETPEALCPNPWRAWRSRREECGLLFFYAFALRQVPVFTFRVFPSLLVNEKCVACFDAILDHRHLDGKERLQRLVKFRLLDRLFAVVPQDQEQGFP